MDADGMNAQAQRQTDRNAGRPVEGMPAGGAVTQWVLSVPSTGQNLMVRPGQTIVLGRTPLRAASVPSEPGEERLNINDPRKSLSKRHLSLTVDENGQASVCDFNSTNGTYVVRSNGDLLRIPPARALVLDESPVHLQLGDVSVLLGKVASPGAGVAQSGEVHQSAEMSSAAPQEAPVRAGVQAESSEAGKSTEVGEAAEPEQVAQASEAPSAPAVAQAPSEVPGVQQPGESDGNQQAQSQEAGDEAESPAAPVAQSAALAADSSEVSGDVSEGNAFIAGFTARKPVEDLFAVARRKQDEEEKDAGSQPAEDDNPDVFDVHDVLDVRAGEPTSAFDTRTVERHVADRRRRDAAMPSFNPTQPSMNAAAQQGQRTPMQQIQSTPSDLAASSAAFNPGQPVGVQPVQQPQVTGFEPGSVLDRLTRGEMTTHKPEVEIDGMTSDEARTTENHARQFEMAKHHEFLPYLSLNPYLYDDLYAWLGAMGDPTVDAALAMNSGYQEFVQKRK